MSAARLVLEIADEIRPPGSGSWLNAVETFFSALTRRRIRRGSFHSIVDLQAAINCFIAEHNADPEPFTWTKPADEILTEGYLEVARAIEPYRLMWLEIDSYDPGGRASIRHASRTPIASCESLFGRRQFRPFLDAHAVDVAIVDVPWNGILEGFKIAAMAECYEVNCAPHNFYGHLSTMMSAHFCATIGNLRIMEIDIDDVPWKDEVVSRPAVEAGHLVLSLHPARLARGHASERSMHSAAPGALSSLLAFPASLATLLKLTSAACSPRLNLAISRSIKRMMSSR